MTKIVCISDTHNQHNKLTVPDGDVLIHAGDATGMGRAAEILPFLEWMSNLPHRHKIFIAGNHDILYEDNPDLARDLLFDFPSITYLQDSSVEVEGLKIWGSPWTEQFFDWAFNVERLLLHEKWENIPKDVDIVVTHGPIFKVGDKAPRMNGQGFEHCGCPDLKRVIEEIKPRLHVCGHIHEGYGVYDTDGKILLYPQPDQTICVNASSLDGNYRKINDPIVIDL